MQIILSCTTTNERLDFLFHTLLSLVNQSFSPDVVFLNVSQKAYLQDQGISEIPDSIKELNLPLKINWTSNTGPYRKLTPIIDEVKEEDIIITFDDDVLYHRDWLNNMVSTCEKHPEAIVAGAVRQIKKNLWGGYTNYSNWTMKYTFEKGIDFVPIGIDGVAYRKKLLDLNFIRDEKFLEIAPKTDDLWFKMASYRRGTVIVFHPRIAHKNAYIDHKKGLQEENRKGRASKNYLVRKVRDLREVLWGYFGINLVNNDYSWDRIIDYHKMTKK